jgi:hypothetical protein
MSAFAISWWVTYACLFGALAIYGGKLGVIIGAVSSALVAAILFLSL